MAVCRLCSTAVAANRRVGIFSPSGLQHGWASRIRKLLGIVISCNDGLPGFMCEKCRQRIESLETAMKDLKEFQAQAQQSSETLTASQRSQKRVKDTSGEFVSPATQRARPPCKRPDIHAGRRLDFDDSG